jgi:hypothetical protein
MTTAKAERIVTPCETNPALYDAEAPSGKRCDLDRLVHEAAISEAIAACLFDCPLLDVCRAYAADHPDVFGVIAGLHRPWPAEKRRIHYCTTCGAGCVTEWTRRRYARPYAHYMLRVGTLCSRCAQQTQAVA